MKKLLLILLLAMTGLMGIAQTCHQGAVVVDDGVLYMYQSGKGFTLIKYPDDRSDSQYKVPSSLVYRNPYTGFEYEMDVTTIAAGAFANPNLMKLILPSTIYYIHEFAFSGCKGLKNFSYYVPSYAPNPKSDEEKHEVARYNLQGNAVSPDEKGIQIVVFSDYTTKTEIVE